MTFLFFIFSSPSSKLDFVLAKFPMSIGKNALLTEPCKLHDLYTYIKGHWTTAASSPDFFKTIEIFIPLQVYTYVMTACLILFQTST